MPMSHDQPNNAYWVKQRGVGQALLPRKFTGKRVAKILGELLGSAEVKARCADFAARCRAQNAIGETVDLIESAADANPESPAVVPSVSSTR
jgi:UDP:flavonoid glycosyltransferase YjiC (YdhE family)